MRKKAACYLRIISTCSLFSWASLGMITGPLNGMDIWCLVLAVPKLDIHYVKLADKK